MLASRYLVLAWLGVMMTIVAFWSVFWDTLCTPTLVRLFDPKLPKGNFGHAAPKDPEPPSDPAS
jgi:hypothetical protein